MKKMRVLMLALLLVFTASLTMACGVPFERTWTVTFATAEGETLTTIEVKDGNTIDAESVPQAPAAEDTYAFDGWYAGDAKLDADYAVTGHVTFTAKYVKSVYVLTFKNGDDTVQTVRWPVGEEIKEGDLPQAPEAAPGYEFKGWFNGDTQLRLGDVPDKDQSYEAKYEKNAYKVTLVYGDKEYAAYVLYTGNGKVAERDLPALTLPEGSVLLGWYNENGNKLNSVAIDADCTYYAQVVNKESYQGAWYSDEAKLFLIVDADGKVYISTEQEDYGWTFANGSLKIVVKTRPYDNYTLTLLNGRLQLVHAYWDDIYEDAAENYTLAKSEGLTGLYESHGGQPIEFVQGMVKQYGGSIYYGRVTNTENGYTALVYSNSNSSTPVEYPFTFDEKGNLVNKNNNYIYTTGTKVNAYSNYIDEKYHYLIVYEVNGETLYVYRDATQDTYVTIRGEVGEGKIITIVEKDLQVKLSGTNFLLKAAEAGTYTGADGELTLDGFGNATLGGQTYGYTINGDEVTANGKVYVLDAENASYTVKEYIGYEGKYLYEMSSTQKYYIQLDGYGTFTAWYNSTTKYVGTYTVGETALTVTGTGKYSYDGTYNLHENGNVLIYSSVNGKNGYVYVKEGAVIETKLGLFFEESNGVYVNGDETLTLTQDDKKVEYLGKSYSFTGNYNYTELYFKAKYAKDKYGNTCDFTLKLDENKNLLLHVKYITAWDDVYEEYTYGEDNLVYAPYKEPNYFLGEYRNAKDNYRIKITENEFMFGAYEDGTVAEWKTSAYTIENNVLKAYCYFENWTLTLVEGKEGYISVTSDVTYQTAVEFAESSVALYDKMYGEYEAYLVENGNAQTVTFKFNGLLHDGNPLAAVTYNGKTVELEYNFSSYISLDGQSSRLAYCGILNVSSLISGVNKWLLVLNDDGSLTAYASDNKEATSDNAYNLTLYKKGALPALPDTYEVGTAEELKAALKNAVNGNTIIFTADMVIDRTLVIDKDITLNLNGKTLSNTTDLWNDAEGVKTWSLISVAGGATVTLDGNGKLLAKENDCFGIDVCDGSKLTINSGYINGNVHAVYVFEGTLTVNGGKFEIQQTYATAGKEYEFVLNCYDANRESGTAKITVYGGEFVKFNPANCMAEGANTNFVAAGYASTLGKDGTTYTVSQQLDELAGTWTCSTKVKWTITFDGKGSAIVNSGYGDNAVKYTYNVKTKTVTFSFGDDDYTGTYDGTYLTLTGAYDQILNEDKFTKKTEEILDEIAGTWTFGDWTLTFDGKGTLAADNGDKTGDVAYTYNAEKKTLDFTFAGYNYSGKYDGTNLIISDEDEEVLVNNKFTKQA